MAMSRLFVSLFGVPDPVPPPATGADEEVRLAENEERIERALRESREVSRELRRLSSTLQMLLLEYRRVRR
jgi:hypothetical protein